MTKEEKFYELFEAAFESADSSEIVELWNAYCAENRYYDQILHSNDEYEINEIFSEHDPYKLFRFFTNNTYNKDLEWFTYNETTEQLEFFEFASDGIYYDDLVDWVWNNTCVLYGHSAFEDIMSELDEWEDDE